MPEKWSAEEEERLLPLAQNGDSVALEHILRAYQPLLTVLANRLCVPFSMREELVQAGYVGMMQAIERFSPTRGTRLSTYAVPWILGEMKKALACMVDDTGALEKHRSVMRREAQLREALGRAPHLDELAQACAMTVQQVAQIEACASAPLSLEAGETVKAPDDCLDMDRIDLRMALEALDEEARRLVYLRYFRGQTQQETACLLQKSQAQVSRIERRALDRLRELLA